MNDESRWIIWVAEAMGRHALAVFLVVLACTLIGTWLTMRALHRHAVPHLQARLPTAWLGVLVLAVGFAVVLAGGWVFAEIADEIQAEEDMGLFDDTLTRALQQSVPLSVVRVFALLTQLGDVRNLVALCIAVTLGLLMMRRFWLALGWALTTAGGGLLNMALKRVFERVRPVHDDGLVAATGFSFPSGHSSGSLVVYGMLAYLALRLLPARWHLPAALLAVSLAITIGASRVFLRVHFASDVVAGLAFGAAWLAVCVVAIELMRWWRRA